MDSYSSIKKMFKFKSVGTVYGNYFRFSNCYFFLLSVVSKSTPIFAAEVDGY